MIIYVDTSVVLGVFLKQKGYLFYRKALQEAQNVVSGPLLIAEMAAVFKREEIDLAFLQPCIESVSIYYPNNELVRHTKNILQHGYCRGADLFHLACALSLDIEAQQLTFATYDKQQKKLAAAVGFAVL